MKTLFFVALIIALANCERNLYVCADGFFWNNQRCLPC